MTDALTERLNRISMQWLAADDLERSPMLQDARTLGVAIHGAEVSASTAHLPRAHLLKRVLGREDAVAELWSGRRTARDETVGATRCRHNGEVLFATVSVQVAEADHDALGTATYVAYRSLLDALQATGYPHLLRVWNSIPDINVNDDGLERYRRFNLQRYKAYEESQRPTHTGAPAACALGSFGGPLVLYALASKTPAQPIENPRQVSAYQYPQQYGPRAPSFSRAALWRGVDDQAEDQRNVGDVLFVSGTASIVGHQTLHHGDVIAQTRETIANLQSILAEAVRREARGVATLNDLLLKAYLRRPDDAPAVRQVLQDHRLDTDAVLYLHADICRADLLVEIEAIGPARGLQESPHNYSSEISIQDKNNRYAGLSVSSQ